MIAKIVAAQGGGDFVRLGRYITDAHTEGRTTAAERLAAYVIDAAHDGEKVAWSRVVNCGTEAPGLALVAIKQTQAMNTRAANKTLHLVVSFPEGERPTDAQLHAIEDGLCAALGMWSSTSGSRPCMSTPSMPICMSPSTASIPRR